MMNDANEAREIANVANIEFLLYAIKKNAEYGKYCVQVTPNQVNEKQMDILLTYGYKIKPIGLNVEHGPTFWEISW